MNIEKELEKLSKEKDFNGVIALFNSVSDEEKQPRSYVACCKALLHTNMRVECFALLEEGLNKFPDSLPLRIRHAEHAMLDKDWNEAILRWRYVSNNFTDFPTTIYWRLAKSYLNNKNYKAARRMAVIIGRVEGESQTLIDFVSIIDSEKTKRYQLSSKKLSKDIHFRIKSNEVQDDVGTMSFFASYRFRGWVKKPLNEEYKLIVKTAGSISKVVEYDLNVTRKDVAVSFDKRGEQVDEVCGFNYRINVSEGADIGFLINGEEFYVLSISLKLVLSVLEGKDGWLFLANDANRSVDQYTGKRLILPEERSDWIEFSKKISDYQSKINLVYLIASSKEKIISEKYHFPKGDKTVTEEVKAIFDDVGARYVHPVSKLNLNNGSYYKTDTHWSDYGAYLGFLETIRSVGYEDELENIEFKEIEVIGDLGAKMSPPMSSKKKIHSLPGAGSLRRVFCNNLLGTGAIEVFVNDDAKYNKSVLLFGGSSIRAGGMYKYFGYLFSRVVVVNLPSSIVYELVEVENPDIVVIQTNERYLVKPGKVYVNYVDSPLFHKINLLSLSDKKMLINDIKQYESEAYYVSKTLQSISL